MVKQHLLRSAVAAATCSFLVLTVAPPAHADLSTGALLGFVHTDIGWTPVAPDTSRATCQPKLHADSYRPEFTHLVIGPTTLSLTETADATAYISRWECGSQAIIGAFRMTDYALYSIGDPASTGWEYLYGTDLVRTTLQQQVTRNFARDEPTFTGTLVVEAGAWWGRPEAGRLVYYPAGCVQQTWLYTIVAWSNAVEAQPVGPETACAQPPLPGMPELPL